MPGEKFRSITVDAETYEKLKKIAEERKLPVSRVIATMLARGDLLRRILENTEKILEIVSTRGFAAPPAGEDIRAELEELKRRISELEARLAKCEKAIEELRGRSDAQGGEGENAQEGNGRNDAQEGDGKKDRLRNAFLGRSNSEERFRDIPIVVRTGEFYLEGIQPSGDLEELARKYNARVMPEGDEKGNVIGVSLVPNTGFSDGFESGGSGGGGELEEWYEKHGKALLKELVKRFKK